jgi:class 3 adenylate cyclase
MQHGPPIRKELTVLFVDIADSTVAVVNQTPEAALAQVQRFMQVVTDAALAYCGDVKDYEGDGALLYFESVTEAAQAALAIRDALDRARESKPNTPQARFSLNVGNVVIGVIGTALRRSVALIGPSINLAARLLKQIPPGGIIATATVVERLQQEAPELGRQFRLWNERLELKGFQNEFVSAFHVPRTQNSLLSTQDS